VTAGVRSGYDHKYMTLKSSPAISRVNVEFVFDVSETVSPSSGFDVSSVVCLHMFIH
jgi:hypothetical protein